MVVEPNTRCEMVVLTQAEIDGELDVAQAISVGGHRASCAECTTAYQVARATRRTVPAHATYYQPSSGLRNTLGTMLRDARTVAAPARRGRLPAVRHRSWRDLGASFGLGAVIAAGLAMFLVVPRPQDLSESIVSGHIRALQPGHLMDVPSTDSHTVMPWFDGKLDFAPPVKNLAKEGFPLDGGRLDYIDGRAVAALVYHAHLHPIDLFVWPNPDGSDTTPTVEVRNGYTLCHWTQQKMTIWVVSDLNSAKLDEFVNLWRNFR
jgi:anti-sigma factor RsiW